MTATAVSVFSRVYQLTDRDGRPIGQPPNVSQLITAFIQKPTEKSELFGAVDSPVAAEIKAHQTFLFGASSITFKSADETVMIELDFSPIVLGSFRCLLLFVSEEVGEFAYEIIGVAAFPQTPEPSTARFKCEAGKKLPVSQPVDVPNMFLIRALAHSLERAAFMKNPGPERKFRDAVTRRVHEIELHWKQSFTAAKFSVLCSAVQYFETPQEFVVHKHTAQEAGKSSNLLPIVFKPTKAGEYPCRIVLMNAFDIRCLQVRGIGLAATRELSLEFAVTAGKTIRQDLPFSNPSSETWNYKITVTGDPHFSAPTRLVLKGNSQGTLSVGFVGVRIGTFTGEMQVLNQTKESLTIYKLSAVVDEPPAEGKITMTCQARQKVTKTIDVKPFVRTADVVVTTTVPLIEYESPIHFVDGVLDPPFSFSVNAPRSGLLGGIITFTDPATKTYIWYVLEAQIDLAAPEGILTVQTIARRAAPLTIPISNPAPHPVTFTVTIPDNEISGGRQFTVEAGETVSYRVVVSPLKAGKRTSSIYFYSDDESEFWYSIRIEIEDPPVNILAPVTAPIGRTTSTFILLDNPTKAPATFRVENDSQTAWQVMTKRVIQLLAAEKRRVEIRYIPTSIGGKETATIAFRSPETGDQVYRVSGTGKPPQPLSPTLVSSSLDQTKTALLMFTNPFPYPSRFSMSISGESDSQEVFKFLLKRRFFSLNSYGEEYQIPFAFSPVSIGEFHASIVVASLGPARGPLPELEALPSVRWVYPVIGTSVEALVHETHLLKSRSQEVLEKLLKVTLIGETEVFTASEYALKLELPHGYEYIRSILDIQPTEITRSETGTELSLRAIFSPQRPFQQSVTLIVTNPLSQEWHFQIELTVELGKPSGTIVIESLLSKTGVAKIQLPVVFRNQVPFHAYFTAGSASEFSLSAAHGMIEPSLSGLPELPVDLLFSPKMYGKLLKALLVIDTVDSQFLFDIVGKTPDYVPPVVTRSMFDRSLYGPLEPPKKKANSLRPGRANIRSKSNLT
jgi:hypothetical protein